jgi:hypothetical protein
MMTSARAAASLDSWTRRPAASAFEADDDVEAAVFQVEGMRVSLAAVAEDGDGSSREAREVGVVLVVDLGH